LISAGKTYVETQNIIGCSSTMITNAVKYEPANETRGRPKLLDKRSVDRLRRQARIEPFASAASLKKTCDLNVSLETVRRRLRDNNLISRSPRKVPLLTKKHAAKRLKFARQHLNWPLEKWRNILWSDESKIVLFGGRGSRQFVRRPPLSAFSPKCTLKTVKHGGSSIMIWASFSHYGVGPIYWVKTIMDRYVHVNILNDVMLPYASEDMPLIWTFQQDNDPKHSSKHAREWFAANQVNVMEWTAQSPDLNPIENLWCDVKRAISEIKPSNNFQLWEAVQRTWSSIPVKRCQNLVDSMHKRCAAVIANKGYATKY